MNSAVSKRHFSKKLIYRIISASSLNRGETIWVYLRKATTWQISTAKSFLSMPVNMPMAPRPGWAGTCWTGNWSLRTQDLSALAKVSRWSVWSSAPGNLWSRYDYPWRAGLLAQYKRLREGLLWETVPWLGWNFARQKVWRLHSWFRTQRLSWANWKLDAAVYQGGTYAKSWRASILRAVELLMKKSFIAISIWYDPWN